MICSGILYSWGQIQRIPTLSKCRRDAYRIHGLPWAFKRPWLFIPSSRGFKIGRRRGAPGTGASRFKARTANATRLKSCELPARNEEKRPDFRTKEARILLRKDWLQGANGALLIRLGAQSAPDLSPPGQVFGRG